MDKLLVSARLAGIARWATEYLNPVTASPAAPLESAAWVESFGPSLMPRASTHQGMMTGISVLSARSAAGILHIATGSLLAPDAPLSHRLLVRGVAAGAGVAASLIPEDPAETLWKAGARSGGHLLWQTAVGGAVYDIATGIRDHRDSDSLVRPIVLTIGVSAGLAYAANRLRVRRGREIQNWPVPQPNTLPKTVAIAAAVTAVGTGISKAYGLTRKGLHVYLGEGKSKRVLSGIANAALWAAGTSFAYNAGVGYLGRANEKVEPGYSTPPTSPLVSGSKDSVSPFEDLGQQGRRYVTDVVTPALIEDVMGEPAVDSPIRVFVGYNSEPIYSMGRAEMALEELDRTCAFDRSHLLLVSPTGTGWVDHTMIEAVEFLTRGDVATCCIQYGRFPSFLSLQKVQLGRRQFRSLLWGVNLRLQDRPPERRPKVYLFGESLGAWTASDVVMYQGIAGFDHYGIDRALWFGLPGLAKWSRNGMAAGSSDLVPPGSVHVFDRHEEYASLTEEERERLRAVIVSHDNDPIAALSAEMLVKEPAWLRDGRGRNVPEDMDWAPVTTFWQTVVDAMNAMVTVPGEFLSFGHDYRADTARFVRDAYRLTNVTDAQMERIEASLRELELERADRIKAENLETAPPAPAQRKDGERTEGGIPMRAERTRGANWRILKRLRHGDVQ
ncbi:MAG: alpha/beta-hydrolase family protein [Acidimicrobiia bacterium]|nr:alpha/beta-hydrolase family protein [Acidimicrobiia bacterium]